MTGKIRLIMALFLFYFGTIPCFAINWEQLRSPAGAVVYLDRDSIREVDGYYFYNIKLKLPGSRDFHISTIQSNHSHPFSACIKVYTPSEYEALNGDYQNIAKNKT